MIAPLTRETNRVIMTRPIHGICHMQVCCTEDATDEEILGHCNAVNPSGTERGWTSVCRGPSEHWPNVAPVRCAQDPGRLHVLVAC